MYASFERFEIQMTLVQAESMSHSGQCDVDVAYGRRVPAIKRQLEKLDPVKVREELAEYGAWTDDELADHDVNLNRILWMAAGNIRDEVYEKQRTQRRRNA